MKFLTALPLLLLLVVVVVFVLVVGGRVTRPPSQSAESRFESFMPAEGGERLA